MGWLIVGCIPTTKEGCTNGRDENLRLRLTTRSAPGSCTNFALDVRVQRIRYDHLDSATAGAPELEGSNAVPGHSTAVSLAALLGTDDLQRKVGYEIFLKKIQAPCYSGNPMTSSWHCSNDTHHIRMRDKYCNAETRRPH
jgi:hypothetical protein